MGKMIDMAGWVMSEHGVPDSRLTVIKRVDNNERNAACWLCQCSCGEQKQIIAEGYDIRRGHVRSCGCLQKESGTQQILKAYSKGVECAAIKNKKYNEYVLNLEDEYGKYGMGYCSNTCREFYFDMDDYEKIKDICWIEDIRKNGFSVIKGRDTKTNKVTYMHTFLGCNNYDHKDRNELNNRRHNLRPATLSENARNHSISKRNTSGFIGVSWSERRHKWKASIHVNGKETHLGIFTDKKDAIVARLKAEKEYYGEFAPQIHLYEEYGILDNKEGDN